MRLPWRRAPALPPRGELYVGDPRYDEWEVVHDFEDVQIRFAVGRYVRYSAPLMGRVQVFTGRKP